MRFKLVLLSVLLAVAAVTVCAQDNLRVGVQLLLKEGTSFRAGEPITLVMIFKSEVEGYSVSVGQEIIDTVQDEVMISPTSGAFEWKKQFMRGATYTSDAILLESLSEGPVRVEVPLNHFIRFDSPARYTVRVKTKRVRLEHSDPIVELITNDVSFDVRMMTEAEEAAEVIRLARALDKATSWEEKTRLVTELSYLTGNAAIPEKVKRFLAPTDSGNYNQAALYGLYMAQDRTQAIKMLEEVFRDIDRPVSFQLLRLLSTLKLMQEVPVQIKAMTRTPFMYEEEPEELRIRDNYLRELVNSLPRRKGTNLNETAFLILQNLPRKDPPADVLAKIRSILLSHFDELTSFGQEMLLSAHWETIRDPRLVPSLEKMLRVTTYPDYARSILRSWALRRLTELDPVRARPFVIAEILDADSIMTDDTVASFEDRLLPEVDDALVQQIRRFGSGQQDNRNLVRLRLRCLFAARFATKAVFDQLLEIYNTNGDNWQRNSRAFLISYFSRHDPKQALGMIEAEIEKMDGNMMSSLLHDVTRMYYAPQLTLFLERLLASDDARVATSGAYILSLHGPASSRARIEARLDRWVSRWRNREFEVEGVQMKPEDQGEAMLQIQLILSLRNAKNWKSNERELKDHIAECKTQLCDQNFRPLKNAAAQ